ncbi:MAG TPA: carboxylate--amine ligase [Demequina sp.]|nr:carboxylate--amine ligase [Demequina sp.]
MKRVLVVGIGGDIGVYAFQRAAHEKYGWQPVVISQVTTTFMKHSRLVKGIIEPDVHAPDALIARLNDFAADHPDDELILFTNLDWHVRVLAQRRAEIDSRWLMPLCDLATFDRVSSKVAFAAACDAVGVRTPRTLSVVFAPQAAPADAASSDVAGSDAVRAEEAIAKIGDLGLEYPLIGKPSASADWFKAAFPGKLKIHHFANESELVEVLSHLEELAYPSEFLVQEFVPGDETHMRSLTAYRDRQGSVTLLAGGQVLLEEHTPGTLGIPAAILTGVDEEAFESARRILDATDYYGFANFDYKVSSRDGSRVFFEVNPRIGRNNFYVTAAGVNVADAVARDLLPDHYAAHAGLDDDPTAVPSGEILYSVMPYRVLLRYLRDPELRSRVRAAKKRSGVFHPLEYRGDASLTRRLFVSALKWRLAMMLRKHYPAPTDTGF